MGSNINGDTSNSRMSEAVHTVFKKNKQKNENLEISTFESLIIKTDNHF